MAQARSDATKTALMQAAFKLFADKGYAATSTREIASMAKTNIASITYHFGGKAGLRMACAEGIVEKMALLRAAPDGIPLPDALDVPQTEFEAIALKQANMILRLKDAEPMIRFLLREAHQKGEVFDHVNAHFFQPMFTRIHGLFCDAIGDTKLDEEQTRLTVFSIIGQIAYFRIGQPVVLKHMSWTDYHDREATCILATLQRNIRAIIHVHRSPS